MSIQICICTYICMHIDDSRRYKYKESPQTHQGSNGIEEFRKNTSVTCEKQ